MHLSRFFVLAGAFTLAPHVLSAQAVPRDTTPDRGLGVRIRLRRDSLTFAQPAAFAPFGRLSQDRVASELLAESRTLTLTRAIAARRAAIWGEITSAAFSGSGAAAGAPSLTPAPSPVLVTLPADTAGARRNATPDIFGPYADLGVQLQSRMEAKLQRDKNERCLPSDFVLPLSNCRGVLQPNFDFQFGVRTGGVVADRIHVNVDYDSQREFDASNNISIFYQGRRDEILQRLEIGNVSFSPPPSRFITSGIPSGNYGLQVVGQMGPMQFRTIYAQQKGNVIKDRIFTVGDRTLQSIDAQIEDYQMERRRFFWVVDPRVAFPSRYPNVDILDRDLPAFAAQLAPGTRPRRVLVYRYRPPSITGSASRDINGPVAVPRGARNANVVGPWEVLQQGVDYYTDPTNLWIALVSPINRGERLAVSYTVTGPGGTEIVAPSIGGTVPTTRSTGTSTDTLNLLWDDEVTPGDPVFVKEIRSVYRLGGDDIQRSSVSLKVVVGSGGDQEKPVGSSGGRVFDTFLQLFGLSQATNGSTFDADNRLWPRIGDPNISLGGASGTQKLIRDLFVVFPSLKPFSDSGLVHPPNPVNDSIYRTPDEDLLSQRRPPTQYRLRAHFNAEGGGEAGSLSLGSVQVRTGSEHIVLDGIPLTRETDYHVDYELGRVTFLRPDTLFPRPRQVSVRFEENPLFATSPTSIFGLATQWQMENGTLSFTAISQSQQSTFNRPPLGFEPQSALIAGVNGNFGWEAEGLTHALDKLPFVNTTAPSLVSVQGELATSRPRATVSQAYLESFEGEGGVPLQLSEQFWRIGSQPGISGAGIHPSGGVYNFPLDSAATLTWQNLPNANGRVLQYFAAQIDTQFKFVGAANSFQPAEIMMWATLFPRNIGGLSSTRNDSSVYLWRTPGGGGRRWRSISQNLSPTGADLSRAEQLEFYVLIDTTAFGRAKNPALVFDFGDISENSVSFAPETLSVKQRASPDASRSGATLDSTFTGRHWWGRDRLDTERDPITRSFDASRNDTGIPPSVADTLIKRFLDGGADSTLFKARLCNALTLTTTTLADTRANCTAGNRRLDEEDLDLDGVLNSIGDAQRNSERLLRYVIDLSQRSSFNRIGRCYRSQTDTTGVTGGPVCWVRVQVPFSAPTETINDPLVRRIKSMRLTIVSGALANPDSFTVVPIARLKLTGPPWIKRADRPIAGIGGGRTPGTGFVVTGTVGTLDNSPEHGLFYQSPPGVTDQPDQKLAQYSTQQIQVNERSLRIQAGDLHLYERAEAYYRFPEGDKSFMGYRELRVWARGRNKGWGQNGDLQFFVKIGRDQDNFYAYRVPVNAGTTVDAWSPEVVVDFNKLFALRAQVQTAYLRGGNPNACTGVDSALVSRSDVIATPGAARYAACADGYIVYTTNPGVSPPNLAAVQEMAVGIVRVDTAGRTGSIIPTDSLELWVDDVRLGGLATEAGYAGQFGVTIQAADIGTLQANISRRDKNFRQLAEQPTFITDDQFNLAASFRLDRFLPQALGLALPASVSYVRTTSDPFFQSRSDILAQDVTGLRNPKTSATAYSLAARRATPLSSAFLGFLFNTMSLTTTYATSSQQSEFQTGASRSFTSLLDWSLVSPARTAKLPGLLDAVLGHLPSFLRETEAVRSLRAADIRWNPAQIHLSSGYVRNSDDRSSFNLPIAFAGDTARRVTGLTSVWRNASTVELHPFTNFSARWDVTSLRDLRDYRDVGVSTDPNSGASFDVGAVARAEREKLLGVDVGLERERQMSAVISAAPTISTWIRPRFDFTTSYTMLRDPNTRTLLRTEDTTGAFRLPRRLGNAQGLAASATVDIARGINGVIGDKNIAGRLADALQPITINWRRDLRSAFDGVPFTPGLGYQFALGGVNGFRKANGVLATSAGVTYNTTLANAIALPFGLRLANQIAFVDANTWSKVSDQQTNIRTEQRVLPDLSLQWTYNPSRLQWLFTSIGGQARYAVTTATTIQPFFSTVPIVGDPSASDLRTELRSTQYPVNASVTWALLGGFSTSFGSNRTDRRELRSGGVTTGTQRDMNVEAARSFTLPKSWNLKSDQLRARVGYARGENSSYFLGTGIPGISGTPVVGDSTGPKRINDSGRYAYNLNADTDLSETLSASLTISRIVNYDKNYDRRFSQTLISAVLHITFFGGELK
ncbi:MAG: cell surface protein SprA [Gemmatimonadota bacterium]|nr:cell surface protein SprA [Gemmatimonadota bacterium]